MLQHKTTIKLKAAEYFNTSVERIQITPIAEKTLFHLYELTDGEEYAWIKIAKNLRYPKDLVLQKYSLENNLIITELIAQKTKIKAVEIIEFNNLHDLLPNDYILYEKPKENLLNITHIDQHLQQQIDDWNQEIYKLDNHTFGDLLEHQTSISWSDCFHNLWEKTLNSLLKHDWIQLSEKKQADEFYEALYPSLIDEHLPVLINLLPDTTFFTERHQSIHTLMDFTGFFWGTPELEYAKREFLNYPSTPNFRNYKESMTQQIEIKARFFLYYVFCLLEDIVLQQNLSQDQSAIQKSKTMAFTLMQHAM